MMKSFLFVVPEGWSTSARPYEAFITSSSGYSATLNWVQRTIRPGATSFGKPINQTEYKGRGWQQRLVDDAVVWLRSLETTTPGWPNAKKKRGSR